jgi:hypothetical protein
LLRADHAIQRVTVDARFQYPRGLHQVYRGSGGGRSGLERRLHLVVEAAALDLQATRHWVLVHTVEYWLWALDVGLSEDPKKCRLLVEWLD